MSEKKKKQPDVLKDLLNNKAKIEQIGDGVSIVTKNEVGILRTIAEAATPIVGIGTISIALHINLEYLHQTELALGLAELIQSESLTFAVLDFFVFAIVAIITWVLVTGIATAMKEDTIDQYVDSITTDDTKEIVRRNGNVFFDNVVSIQVKQAFNESNFPHTIHLVSEILLILSMISFMNIALDNMLILNETDAITDFNFILSGIGVTAFMLYSNILTDEDEKVQRAVNKLREVQRSQPTLFIQDTVSDDTAYYDTTRLEDDQTATTDFYIIDGEAATNARN